jgi:hypothetical protein
MISESDYSLFKVTDDIDEAVEEVRRFYSNFHSYRYIGDNIIIRMQKELSESQMKRLHEDFSDILKSGGFKQCGPVCEEDDEPELDALPRLVFRHRHRNFGRLRDL